VASITLRDISKRYGNTIALSGINLHIEEGEFCVLLGPSGCGKSTLLRIIAGLVPQDSGTVLMNGRSIDSLSPRDRDIAMVFQNYALYPHMNVSQNLGFGLRMRGIPRDIIKDRIKEVAELLGIEELLHRRPAELSGGQQQRVAMGRALVRRPNLFLLDEPLSNLDARLRAKVRVELKRLHSKIGGTTIYVTHDQAEAMSLGDKIVVMKEGRIRQIGRPEEIYRYPTDTFVARFIGSPEMNLFKGRISVEKDRTYFKGNGFSLYLDRIQFPKDIEEVEVGIRPEHIDIIDGMDGISAKVELINDTGSERHIHARIGKEEIVIRAFKDLKLNEGDSIIIKIDPSKIHLFYKGKRIDEYHIKTGSIMPFR